MDHSPEELYEPACRVLFLVLSVDTPYATKFWKKMQDREDAKRKHAKRYRDKKKIQ